MPTSLDKIRKILMLEVQNKYANRAIIGGLEKFLPALRPELIKEGISEELKSNIESYFAAYSRSSVEDRERSTKDILLLLGEETSTPTTTYDKSTLSKPQYQNRNSNYRNTAPPPSETASKPTHGLTAPLHLLNKIGMSRAADFKNLGVDTIGDLLYFFPRRHDDYSTLKTINHLEYDDVLTIIATVQSTLVTKVRNRELSRVEVVVSDGTGFLRLSFFRGSKYAQNFANQFQHGKQLVISGKVEPYLGRKQMNDPSFEELDQSHLSTNGIIPVYPLTSGLSQKIVRTAVNEAVSFYASRVADFLPESIRTKAKIVDLNTALTQIHYPKTHDRLLSAQRRLAFDEIFLLQLGVLQQKKSWVTQTAEKFVVEPEIINQLINGLPFELTGAQQKTFVEVQKDLASGSPMNRLLQGDVGSGKTIIAALTAAIVVLKDGQAVIMAPTGILAEQHYRSMQKFLADASHPHAPLKSNEIVLLTGDSNPKERETIKQGLLDGSIKLIIGTHALIEDPIQFKNLQFAVIDEQHRFGVAQRAALRKKGTNPHLLVMTATPIPRSLALTLYGDLELSIMDEMPVGRKPVKTYVLSPLERERAYQLVKTQIENGHQAFIVYPLIDQGDNDEVKAAVDDHEVLQKDIFPNLKVGLLHGKMTPDEKESVMKNFRNKEFDILVSTTVIEVGVDIPNATVMMIEGANRFGLAQLHQLRGRVGRGDEQSICLLIPETADSLENERLKVMTETNDGFVLAEKDLEQRGPGDFIGYRQSGFADLRMARITDIRLIELARNVAEELFTSDPMLSKPENALLLSKVSEFWHSENSDLS
ncbi:MAG: ATP-dependent DNA helicase RecG [Anaerolineae bacterium]|nr:ATP-dependent DNA helicase RecG [Anaerolineae bacterium]